MDCREIEELLSAYIDGELNGAEALAVTEHLSICPECRLELLRLQETVNVIRSLPEIEPPFDFHQRLCQRLNPLKEQKPWYKRFSFNRWLGFGAAAALLLCVVSFNIFNPFAELPIRSPAVNQEAEVLSDQAREEKLELDQGNSDTTPPREGFQVKEKNLKDFQAKGENRPSPSNQVGLFNGEAQRQDLSPSSQKPLILNTAPTQPEVVMIVKDRTAKQKNLAMGNISSVDNQYFSYRNGDYREREETQVEPLQLAAVAGAQMIGVEESYSLPIWNIHLKVLDINLAKDRLEDLMFSYGATIRNRDLTYLEAVLPSFSLDEVLALLKNDYLPGTTQIKITSVNNAQIVRNKLEELREKIELKERELQQARDGVSMQILKQELQNLRWQWQELGQNSKVNEIDHILLKIYLQT